MKKILLNERRLLGAVARWAVEQSPYHRPDNLEKVLDTLHKNIVWPDWKVNMGYMEFPEVVDLSTFVQTELRKVPEYLAWNERKNGNPAQYNFTSRYDAPENPDNDFIDLDAMERNVVNTILED